MGRVGSQGPPTPCLYPGAPLPTTRQPTETGQPADLQRPGGGAAAGSQPTSCFRFLFPAHGHLERTSHAQGRNVRPPEVTAAREGAGGRSMVHTTSRQPRAGPLLCPARGMNSNPRLTARKAFPGLQVQGRGPGPSTESPDQQPPEAHSCLCQLLSCVTTGHLQASLCLALSTSGMRVLGRSLRWAGRAQVSYLALHTAEPRGAPESSGPHHADAPPRGPAWGALAGGGCTWAHSHPGVPGGGAGVDRGSPWNWMCGRKGEKPGTVLGVLRAARPQGRAVS